MNIIKPASHPRPKDSIKFLFSTANNKGIKAIQAKIPRLNWGNDNAKSIPEEIDNTIEAIVIFLDISASPFYISITSG